jgi:hypothetical protein
MATLLKVLNNLADIKSAGGVAPRVRTQGVGFDASLDPKLAFAGAVAGSSFASAERSGSRRGA